MKQNRAHFYAVLAKVAITKKQRGVTAHGLRHEFANDVYEEKTGVASPVRGGAAPDRDTDQVARLAVSRLLGHNRGQITSGDADAPGQPSSS